jgi:hypothetical protein
MTKIKKPNTVLEVGLGGPLQTQLILIIIISIIISFVIN